MIEATRIDGSEEVQPLSALREHSAELIERLTSTRRPITLAAGGGVRLVVQEAAAYQRLLDLAAEADEREGVRQGDEDVAAGRSRPASEVFAEMRGPTEPWNGNDYDPTLRIGL